MELEGEKAVLQERLRASEAGYQALLTKLEPSSSADKLSDASAAAAEEAAAAEGGGGAAQSTAAEQEVGLGGASAAAGKRVGAALADQEEQEEEPTYEVPSSSLIAQKVCFDSRFAKVHFHTNSSTSSSY